MSSVRLVLSLVLTHSLLFATERFIPNEAAQLRSPNISSPEMCTEMQFRAASLCTVKSICLCTVSVLSIKQTLLMSLRHVDLLL